MLLVVTAAAVTLALTVPAFGQTYQTVALTGQSAPGTAAGVNYEVFLGPPAVDIGQVVYFARLTGAGVTGANEAAIYAGPAAGPQLVARTGNAAPGTAAGVNYSGLDGSPSLNGTGQVAYLASLTGTGITTANNAAIYAGPVAGPQLVAREGSAAPGTAAGVNYSVLNDTPALNDAGQVAYRAGLTGTGVTTANDAAIYAGPAAGPQLVAREGSAAPGTEAGVNYLSFFTNSTTLNDAGQVAYRAVLTGAGITTANDSAIYAGPAADPRLVARTGDAAPGTGAGVNYSSFFTNATALNDAGQVAYLARLTGPGVTFNDDDLGLFAVDPLSGGALIVRDGQLFDVGGGDLRTITDISFLPGFSLNGRTGLSDDGTLAFNLFFTDGTSGIFTAVVPEPSSLALLGLGGVALLRRRHV